MRCRKQGKKIIFNRIEIFTFRSLSSNFCPFSIWLDPISLSWKIFFFLSTQRLLFTCLLTPVFVWEIVNMNLLYCLQRCRNNAEAKHICDFISRQLKISRSTRIDLLVYCIYTCPVAWIHKSQGIFFCCDIFHFYFFIHINNDESINSTTENRHFSRGKKKVKSPFWKFQCGEWGIPERIDSNENNVHSVPCDIWYPHEIIWKTENETKYNCN